MKVSIWVHSNGEGWATMIRGQRGAFFAHQGLAIRDALRLAQDVREKGNEAEVVVLERFGELWTLDEAARLGEQGPLNRSLHA